MIYNIYKVFCETDQKWEYWTLPEDALAPTTCPINSNHSITLSSVAIASSFDSAPKEVMVSETPPFAKPTYRTKWSATPDVITMTEDSVQTIDYRLPEERYCHGGEIVYSGTKIGDWVEAFIIDDLGIIPEPYRVAVSENYPIIAQYIEKYYIKEGNNSKELNTYPLNAKITQGLCLRVKIHTSSEIGTRKFGVNYFLTKKLP